MASEPDCMIAICDGYVRGAIVCDTPWIKKTLAEWAADPKVQEIVRVPVAVPRKLLFEKWPGREAAIALASASQTPSHKEDSHGEG